MSHTKGFLSFRCEGFLKAKNSAISLSSPADSFSLELETCPDGQRFSSSNASLSMIGNSVELKSILEWKMEGTHSMTWSPQQRKAAFVKLSLFQSEGRYKNGSAKRFISMSTIDIVSLLTTPDCNFLYTLPMYIPGGGVSEEYLAGWVCIGLQFSMKSQTSGNLSTEVQSFWGKVLSLDTSIHHALLDIPFRPDLLRPSEAVIIKDPPTVPLTVHIALGELALTPMAQRELSLSNPSNLAETTANNDPNVQSSTLVIPQQQQQQQPFLAEIRLSTNMAVVYTVNGSYNTSTGSIEWSPADVVIPTQALAESTVLIEIVLKLLKNDSSSSRNRSSTRDIKSLTSSSSTIPSVKYASCSISVTLANLSIGKPINFTVPVRDKEDIRIGNIATSVHSSSIQPSGSRGGGGGGDPYTTGASAFATQITTLSNTTTKYFLLVEYLEGHISQETGGSNAIVSPNDTTTLLPVEATNTTTTTPAALYSASDVFFESLFLIHTDTTPSTPTTSTGKGKRKSRSGYIASHQLQHWGLRSRLLLTPDVAQYLSKVRVWDAVSLGVTVRSSAYPGCPELGRARVALPNHLFQQGNTVAGTMKAVSRTIEQFVTFYSYDTVSSQGWNQQQQEEKKHFAGRVRMRVSLQSESYLPLYRSLPEATLAKASLSTFYRNLRWSNGIGTVMVRLMGIHSSRQPHEDSYDERILFATMTKSSSSLESSSIGTEKVVLQSESFASPSSNPLLAISDYHNVLSSPYLVGSTDVDNSFTHVHLELRSETALSSFSARFPASKAIPKMVMMSSMKGETTSVHSSAANDRSLQNTTSTMIVPEFVVNLTKRAKTTSPVIVTSVPETNLSDPPQPLSDNINHKMDQKVKIQACLVPFVEGTLLVQMMSPVISPAMLAATPILQPQYQSPLMARMSVGQTSMHFADALLPPVQTQVASQSQQTSTTASIRINTYEALHHPQTTDRSRESVNGRGMLPLFIDIFCDVTASLSSTSQIAQTVHAHVDKEPLFVGAVDTAPVYLLALRALLAVSSSSTSTTTATTGASNPSVTPNLATSSSAISISSTSRKRLPSTTKNASGTLLNASNGVNTKASNATTTTPASELIWLTTFVDLYKPSAMQSQSRKIMGRLPIRIAFRPESIPFFIADMIQTLLFPPISLPSSSMSLNDTTNSTALSQTEERLRIELGLKQAFVAADTDGSGTITAAELLAVIQNGQQQQAQLKPQNTISSTVNTLTKSLSTTNSTTRLGLENSSQLLTTLAMLGESSNNGLFSISDESTNNNKNYYKTRSLRNNGKMLTSSSTPTLMNTVNNVNRGNFSMNSSASTSILPNMANSITTNNHLLETVQEHDENETDFSSSANIAAIFEKLDLDGDGTITWCEWKSVLTIAVQLSHLQALRHAEEEQRQRVNGKLLLENTVKEESAVLKIDFLDPLFVLMFAAMNILPTSSPLTPYPEELPLVPTSNNNDNNNNNNNGEEQLEDTFSVMPKQYATDTNNDTTVNPAPTTSTTAGDTSLLPSSKVSSRLNNLVQSLRLTNNLLAQRLETAMTNPPLPGDTAAAGGGGANPYATTFSDFPPTMTTTVQEEEKNHAHAQLILRAFRKEHQHANNLRNEVVALQAEVQQLRQRAPGTSSSPSRPSKAIEQNVSEITSMIATRLQQLETRKWQQRRAVEAQQKLSGFFAKYVFPRTHEKRKELARKMLARWLTIYLRRYRLRSQMEKKQHAAVLIQQMQRGRQVRHTYVHKLQLVQRLQRLFRGFQARKSVAALKEHQRQVQRFQQRRALRVIMFLWKIYYRKKQDRASSIIAMSMKNYQLRKQAKEELHRRRFQKVNYNVILASTVRIQRFFRLWILRRNARKELMRRRAKRDFYKTRAQLINWKGQKPPLDEAVGFWVADVESLMGNLANTMELVLPEHIFMLIERIEKAARICIVKYLPEQTNPDVTPDFQQTYIPYDHPTISWFSLEEPPKIQVPTSPHRLKKPEEGESNTPQEAEDNVSVYSQSSSSSSSYDEEAEALKRQEALLATHLELLRFKQVLYSPDGAEMQSRKGLVTQYNVANRTIGIEFQPTPVAVQHKNGSFLVSSPSSKTDIAEKTAAAVGKPVDLEWLPYDHPYLAWIQGDGTFQAGGPYTFAGNNFSSYNLSGSSGNMNHAHGSGGGGHNATPATPNVASATSGADSPNINNSSNKKPSKSVTISDPHQQSPPQRPHHSHTKSPTVPAVNPTSSSSHRHATSKANSSASSSAKATVHPNNSNSKHHHHHHHHSPAPAGAAAAAPSPTRPSSSSKKAKH